MKQFTLILFFFTSCSLIAQVQYGTIDYVRSTEMEISGDMAENKEIKAMLAQMSASGAFNRNYQATFGPGQFNCMEKVKEAAENTKELSGGNSITIMAGTQNLVGFFTNTETGEVLNTDNILDKSFLVSGELPALEWTITEETVAPSEATVGLDLKIATAITPTGDTLTAGFAPSLPVQVGPLNYYGLPGAIITLEQKSGGPVVMFRATNISLSTEPLEITKPTEGKPISLEKYRQEVSKRRSGPRMQRREVRRG